MADELLGPVCTSYWLNTAQAMLIGPGEPAQFLHRDADNWSFVNALTWPNTPEITINMVLAFEDVYDELGATRVIPGSHLWEDYRRQGLPEESVPAEISAGSAIIYSGKTIHGGGANRTEQKWRMAMQMSFVAGWLTPEEACAFEYSVEKVQALSPRAQRLLGFRSYDPAPHVAGKLWLKDFSDLDVVGTAS